MGNQLSMNQKDTLSMNQEDTALSRTINTAYKSELPSISCLPDQAISNQIYTDKRIGWSVYEDNNLVIEMKKGTALASIALYHERSEIDITDRINQLRDSGKLDTTKYSVSLFKS
jgi:hypothetical protein